GYTNLTVGNWYYISVDNNYSGYRGTFTLCIDNTADYDFYEGAFLLTDKTNWCSADAAYTTIGATPDKNAASCWNTSPNYNRWFKFQATATGMITITVLRGGAYGTIRRINLALWESDGLTEIACKRYVGDYDNVTIQTTGLTPGSWYYISVDNNYSGYRGSFTLCLHDGSINWNGSEDTAWDNPANWDGGTVPDESISATIPGGAPNYPVIPGVLYIGINYGGPVCESLTIEDGAQVDVTVYGQISLFGDVTIEEGGSLNVNRFFVSTGGALYNGGGDIFVGTEAVFPSDMGGSMTGGNFTIYNMVDFDETPWYATGGTIYVGSSAGNATMNITGNLDIYNLEVESGTNVTYNGGTTNVFGDFTIQPGGGFDLATGSMNVTGNTYFEADASGMAAFIDNGTLSVTGTSTVEQYLTSERWHLVSAPISDAQIATFLNIYLKEYDEPSDSWTYLVQPVTQPMNVLQGYSAWASDLLTGSTTVGFNGLLNTGTDYPVTTLSYTAGNGWNLLGNPYPAPLQWNNTWSKTDLSEWACVHNNGIDECYNALTGESFPDLGDMSDGIIPSTQGFWVRATSASAALTIPASERTFSDQAFYKESLISIDESVRFRVDGNNAFDAALIQFIGDATQGYDPKYDLEKRWGYDEAPQIYSIIDENNVFSVNVLPQLYIGLVVPLGLKVGAPGEYQIALTQLDNMKDGVSVVLEDLKENTLTEMNMNEVYSFTSEPIDEVHRFNVHFKDAYFGIDNGFDHGISIYSYEDVVYVNTNRANSATITVYDIMGQEIAAGETSGNGLTSIPIAHGTGYYIVKVISDMKISTEKVFIK
ncbi:MAG: T9SS type A sorting domain-containing protein, partial [Bacteroidales bacterium]|nr:T9SS type A sorting domain-containing protein [Bacteroidales bacterium]